MSYEEIGHIVMSGPPGCSALDSFYFVYITIGVGRPDSGGVFQQWSNKCFIGCG